MPRPKKPDYRKNSAGAGRAGKFPASYTAASLREAVAVGLANSSPFADQTSKQIKAVLTELNLLPPADRALLESHNVTFGVERDPNARGRYDFLNKKITLSQDVLYDLTAPNTPAGILADARRTVRHEVGHAMDSFHTIAKGGKMVENGKSMDSKEYIISYSPAFQAAVAKDLAANRDPSFITGNKYFTAPNAVRKDTGDHWKEMFAQTYAVISASTPGSYEKQWEATFAATSAFLRSKLTE